MKVAIDGKEVEVFTAEEVQARANEHATKQLEQYKTEHPDQSSAITKLQADLEQSKKDLEAVEKGGDTGQVRRLIEARDAAQKALTEGIGKITKDFEEFKSSTLTDLKVSLLDRFAGKNDELRKKVQFEFDNYRPNDNTKAAIEERMAKAFTLATGNKPAPGLLDGISGAGARGDGYDVKPASEETANGAAMRKVFGISDENVKKAKDVLAKHKPIH